MNPPLNWGKSFAFAQLLLCIAASIGYLFAKDWRRAIYWGAAAVISGSITL